MNNRVVGRHRGKRSRLTGTCSVAGNLLREGGQRRIVHWHKDIDDPVAFLTVLQFGSGLPSEPFDRVSLGGVITSCMERVDQSKKKPCGMRGPFWRLAPCRI